MAPFPTAMENAKNQRLWILKDRKVHVQNAERWNLMDMCDNGVWPPKLTATWGAGILPSCKIIAKRSPSNGQVKWILKETKLRQAQRKTCEKKSFIPATTVRSICIYIVRDLANKVNKRTIVKLTYTLTCISLNAAYRVVKKYASVSTTGTKGKESYKLNQL